MALISLSDWLDRFGDGPAPTPAPSELDSLRFDVSELPPPAHDDGVRRALRASWRLRLRQAWQRASWRLRRLANGHA